MDHDTRDYPGTKFDEVVRSRGEPAPADRAEPGRQGFKPTVPVDHGDALVILSGVLGLAFGVTGNNVGTLHPDDFDVLRENGWRAFDLLQAKGIERDAPEVRAAVALVKARLDGTRAGNELVEAIGVMVKALQTPPAAPAGHLEYRTEVGEAGTAYLREKRKPLDPYGANWDGLPGTFRWQELFEAMQRAALPGRNRSAMQPWTLDCSVMMQSVMMSAIRGMDGLPKLHPAKMLIRFYRRSILLSAFDQAPINDAYSPLGGDFTGPSLLVEQFTQEEGPVVLDNRGNGAETKWIPVARWMEAMEYVASNFIRARDEMPLHYFTHTMHAFHIVGVYHPVPEIANFWRHVYERMVDALHLWVEPDEAMKLRLSDDPEAWRARMDPAGSCQT